MIIPKRLADGSGYALECSCCNKTYSVTTTNLDGTDPESLANVACEPLPKGCTSVAIVDGKLQVAFTCPACHSTETIRTCSDC